MGLIYLSYFPSSDQNLCQISAGSENVVSTIEVNQSFLTCSEIPNIEPRIVNDFAALLFKESTIKV